MLSPMQGPRLIVTGGPRNGFVYPLRLGAQLIGRADNADVLVDSQDVSRKHAQVSWDGTSAVVVDAGSRSGTIVNGHPITGTCPLRSGDVLQVGSVELRFEALGSEVLGGAPDPNPSATPVPLTQLLPEQAAYLDFREEWPAAAPSPRTADETARGASSGNLSHSLELEPGDEAANHRRSAQEGAGSPVSRAMRDRPVGAPPRSGVRGVARSVELRFDQPTNRNVLTFHLDRYDTSGNRLTPVGVEMSFPRRGQVTEGDEVDVVGSVKHGTLIAKRIVNITTGSEMKGGVPKGMKVVGFLFLALMVLAFVFVGAMVVLHH
jgi:pSer/pThr/pTyr-binding forkhead associated (FHA) protein